MNVRICSSIFLLITSLFFVKINSQKNDINLKDVFSRHERVQLRYFFNKLKNVLSKDMIRIQDYQDRMSSNKKRERHAVLHKLFQDEKKVNEIEFLIEIINSMISPLTGKFNTTNYEKIAISIPNKMDTIFESFSDDTKNEFVKLRVAPSDWRIISNMLFENYDTFLSDAEKTFYNFEYSAFDKNLLRRLFDYFITIAAKNFETLTKHREDYVYETASTLPTYRKQISDAESSQSADYDSNEAFIQEKVKKEDFEKVAPKEQKLLGEIDKYNNTQKSVLPEGVIETHQVIFDKIKNFLLSYINIKDWNPYLRETIEDMQLFSRREFLTLIRFVLGDIISMVWIFLTYVL